MHFAYKDGIRTNKVSFFSRISSRKLVLSAFQIILEDFLGLFIKNCVFYPLLFRRTVIRNKDFLVRVPSLPASLPALHTLKCIMHTSNSILRVTSNSSTIKKLHICWDKIFLYFYFIYVFPFCVRFCECEITL